MAGDAAVFMSGEVFVFVVVCVCHVASVVCGVWPIIVPPEGVTDRLQNAVGTRWTCARRVNAFCVGLKGH